jgi:hypothetical protein
MESMVVHLEFVVPGPPISNQQCTTKGKANLLAWKATVSWEAQGSPPMSLLNELISLGIISPSDFRDLEGLSRLRNIIVHGFSVPEVGSGVVPLLVSTARRLMEEANGRGGGPRKDSAAQGEELGRR